MHVPTAILIATLLAAPLAIPADAHTLSERYDVPSGPKDGLPTASTRLCAEEWDDWDEGVLYGPGDDPTGPALTTVFTTACTGVRDTWAEDGIKIGVYRSDAGAHDTDGIVTFIADDDHFDSTFLKVCIETCIPELTAYPPNTYYGCGALHVPQADEYLVFVYAVHMYFDSGETCFGSSGEVRTTH